MNYQLVLQFQGDDDDTIEALENFEDFLHGEFGDSNAVEIEGQEVGDGVVSLVLSTKNAEKLWEHIEPMLEGDAAEDLELNAVAFRKTDSDEYVVLWPTDYEGEFEI